MNGSKSLSNIVSYVIDICTNSRKTSRISNLYFKNMLFFYFFLIDEVHFNFVNDIFKLFYSEDVFIEEMLIASVIPVWKFILWLMS